LIKGKTVGYFALIAVLILVPFFVRDPRWVHLIITMGMYIMLAGGLRLIMGTGQVSFAHAGFWAIGAYASALLVLRGGLSFWLALPLSGVICGIVGLLIGYPCLKLKGPYFFLTTMAFGEILRLVFTSWVDVFGGDNGISGIPYPNRIAIPGLLIEFSSKSIHYYYLMLLLLLPTLFLLYRLERSRFGTACSAIREYDSLAESLGIDVMRHKVIAFLVACILAGLTGSFFAHYMTYISPGFFTFNESNLFLIMAAIGGTGSASGVIIGVILVTLIAEFAKGAARFDNIIFGATLVVILLFIPGGLWSLRVWFLKRIPYIKKLQPV
jgi:branched-chain amino acid transport system permease protein